MKRTRPSFELPGSSTMARRAERDAAQVRKEVTGPTYQMVLSDQRQEAEPHGVPPGYEHPLDLRGFIIAGGPRVLPVSQEIEHGPQPSRSEEFEQAMQTVANLGALHRAIGFKDRRFYGRRYRPTDDIEELEGHRSRISKGGGHG